jgi:hypothetical protein
MIMNGALVSFSSAGDLGSALTPPSLALILPDVSIVHARTKSVYLLHCEIGTVLFVNPLNLVFSLNG